MAQDKKAETTSVVNPSEKKEPLLEEIRDKWTTYTLVGEYDDDTPKDIVIRKWSYGTMSKLNSAAVNAFKNIAGMLSGESAFESLTNGVAAVSESVKDLIIETLMSSTSKNKFDKVSVVEFVGDLDPDDALGILRVIVRQNYGSVKNWVGGVMQLINAAAAKLPGK